MEHLAKAFTEIALSTPVWFRIVLLTVACIVILGLFLKSTNFAKSFQPKMFSLGLFRVQLLPTEDAEPDPFDTGYHKLLYVKVLSLRDMSIGGPPIYTRCVNRLEPAKRNVPVYDEAVYYTLEHFPKKQLLNAHSNNSSGVIDSRRIIPWLEKYAHPDPGSTSDPHNVTFDLIPETDTFLSIGHYLNGLQGNKQDFRTRVYQDTNDARLVVDLSSIPANKQIVLEVTGQITRGKQGAVQDTDPRELSPGVYTILCTDAREGDTLVMYFTFDRALAPHA